MDTRAREYRLIGYQTWSILRLWDPQTDKVITSSDVVFKDDLELRPFATLAINPFVNAWPKTYKEAMKRKEAAYWRKSMQREIDDLERRKTWTLVPYSEVPKGEPIAPGNWVYIEKDRPNDPNVDPDGILRKSRWVICGNRLRKSSIEETYAPVANPTTNRLIIVLATKLGWKIRQADVVMAYLHGRLKKPVYMRQPTSFEQGIKGSLVCKVEGSLYGLDPAAKIWYDALTSLLKDLGFRAKDEPDADWLINSLLEKLEIKDLLIPKKYLGMEIKEVLDENSGKRTAVRLTQTRYIEQLIEDFRLENANPVQTPLDTSFIPDDKELPEQEARFTKQRYQYGIGCLQYLACYKQLLLVLHYLKGSKNLGIEYRAEGTDVGMPLGYSDSDWAGPLNGDRKSTGGFVFILAGAPIGWKSNKQFCVALSSNEAEYMALSEAVREATWLRNLLLDLSLDNLSISDQNPIKVCVDNKGAIDLAKIDGITKRLKHVNTRFHYSREQQLLGVITIVYVPTTEMATDSLIKPLPTPSFRRFINQLGLR
ncbi:hypothetical protein VTO42DRAFT_1726 [Malbranchea cinnamomea]